MAALQVSRKHIGSGFVKGPVRARAPICGSRRDERRGGVPEGGISQQTYYGWRKKYGGLRQTFVLGERRDDRPRAFDRLAVGPALRHTVEPAHIGSLSKSIART